MTARTAKILIDAVFFQYNRSGIARVWRSLLKEWVRDGFAQQLLVLDRQGSAPQIPGIVYRTIPAHNYGTPDQDKAMLQQVCDEEKADLFISSYYTTPISTPSVFMAYDMIPEILNWDIAGNAMWTTKHEGIRHAADYISISQNTAKDLLRFFPAIPADRIIIAHCGVDFTLPATEKVSAFKTKYGIAKPYFLLVGSRAAYKNGLQFFQAFSALGDRRGDYAIICTGPWASLEPEFAAYVGDATVHMVEVDDEELQCAYGGALALAYPSIYEGFGMPITEAMACSCPVITCPVGSIPEVAGDAVIYVAPGDVNGMAQALLQVQDPAMRSLLINKGLQQISKFSWARMATEIKEALLKILARPNPSALNTEPTYSPHNQAGASMLSKIIPGEIVNDDFYKLLHSLASRPELKTFLEIGSSSGAGSTHAFVSALKARPDADQTRLYCMELSTERYTALKAAYADCNFVKVYNQSSVSMEEFPSEQEVAFFYANTRTTLNTYPVEQVISWLRQDLEYMKQSGLTRNGIEVIKSENGLKHFDMVLIDGSEFTGEAEMYHTMGAKIIALDDVNSHKCFNVYRMLSNHVNYALTHQNFELRNGYAVFERRF
ncbi:MAG TPA: glycosyltransferase family 1 protein [Rhodocyclaceae bacterium]|jgi:glycosyltransferase involved in cell wall biosynthesis